MVAIPRKLGRWATSKLNVDKLEASMLASGGSREEAEASENVEEAAEKLHRRVTPACDDAMPRRGPPRKKEETYWWTT